MMTRFVRAARVTASVMVGVIVLSAWDCDGDEVVMVKRCEVNPENGWPSGSNLTVTKPTECPIYIPGTNYNINFQEMGTFPASTLGAVYVTFYNANDQGISANISFHAVRWINPPPFAKDTLVAGGTYPAGTAGFGGTNTDRAFNDFEISGIRRLSTVRLPYQQSVAATVFGPTEVNPDEAFTLDADLHVANAVPPLAWSWYRAGVLLGTSESLEWNGGQEGNVQDFEVRIVEGNGSQWSATHTVMTRPCTPVPPAIECNP